MIFSPVIAKPDKETTDQFHLQIHIQNQTEYYKVNIEYIIK